MAARSMWKGNLKIGTTRLSVRLYSAVHDHTIRFHVLEKQTLSRIEQHMVDAETGEQVAKENIRQGDQVETGVFVVRDADELTQFEPKPSCDIEILESVSSSQISDPWYERPYWLGPGRDGRNYFAFVKALQAEDTEAVVRWVMGRKEYARALRVQEGYLALVTLRHSEEGFVKLSEIPPLYFEHPYFLAPANESVKAHRLLSTAMEKSGQAGIATFMMRGKAYLGAIIAEDGILRAETMRFSDEIRSPGEVGLPKTAAAIKTRRTQVRNTYSEDDAKKPFRGPPS